MVSFFFFFYVWNFVGLNDGLLACFCHNLTFNQTGGFDHSVFDTLVQLTEGRSARDQPKQPPAKKSGAGANGKKLIGRSLLEVVGINVGISGHAIDNVDTASYHVQISFVGQAHRDLDTL